MATRKPPRRAKPPAWARRISPADRDEARALFEPARRQLQQPHDQLEQRLAALAKTYPTIKPATVWKLLGGRWGPVNAFDDYARLQSIDRILKHANVSARTPEARAVTRLQRERATLAHRVTAAKLDKGRRWSPPPERPATLTIDPAQWGWIGDRAAALAYYLAPRLPAERTWRPGKRVRVAPDEHQRRDVYRTRVRQLTAELVALAYAPWFPGFTFSPQQVRDRLSAKLRRSP